MAVLLALVLAMSVASQETQGGGATPCTTPEKRFEVTASRFQFEPEMIEVNEGDRVVIQLKSADIEHGFAIKKLKVKAKVPKGGEPVIVEFVASKAGSFEIACSEYCGSGHSRMKGKLVVARQAVAGNKP